MAADTLEALKITRRTFYIKERDLVMKSELVRVWILTLALCGVLLAGLYCYVRRVKKGVKKIADMPVPRTVHTSDDELLSATDDLCIVEQEGDLTEYRCGHRYASKFAINAYGQMMRPAQGYWDERERCGDCELKKFEHLTRRCGRCGHVIMPGNGVATYDIHKSFEQKPGVVIISHEDGSRFVMGCLRVDCCPIG